VVPPQRISALGDDGVDTVAFDPGSGIEIAYISMKTGDISYNIRSGTELTSDISLTLPTTGLNGSPLTKNIITGPNAVINGNMSVDNAVFDLGTISSQPYNLLPVGHVIIVSSGGRIVNFSSHDEVQIDLRLPDPVFDYVKGYFGQESGTFGPDTIDTGISGIINNITGELYFSDPSLTLKYSNSFAIPVEVNFQAEGFKAGERTGLSAEPFDLITPDAPGERDASGHFLFDKNNSTISELISMPPYMAVFQGSARMNPAGNTGTRDNYIFGSSRITGSLEVDIPLELRMKNLQLSDTVDNFLKIDDPEGDNPVDPDDFEFMRINVFAENGFPAGLSVSMTLYDSETRSNMSTAVADKVLEPAVTDSNGRVITSAESSAVIEITREFWDSVDKSDKIIFKFSLSTSGNGEENVRIYSDYRIRFTAGLVVKPDIKFNLN
jgi:hypothetical protein